MDMLLSSFCDMILSVKLGSREGKTAISKPLLVYSIIEAIEHGQLNENKILLSNIFIRALFGALYCKNNDIAPNKFLNSQFFIRPYYHLGSSEFYHLIWKEDHRPPMRSNTPSGKYLRENLLYAKLDDNLWVLLQNKSNRDFLKEKIKERYLKTI